MRAEARQGQAGGPAPVDGSAARASISGAPPVLEVGNLSKRFDMTQALKDVSLALHAGEIHALVGENGAGKSTLIKILTGVEQSDEGEVRVEGAAVHLSNAQEAQACGLAAIYQEPLVFPDLDVAREHLHHPPRAGSAGRLEADVRRRRRPPREPWRPTRRAGPRPGLTLAAQQAVEIAKAISLEVKVLIMDEPTASLSDHEVRQLFRVARQLRDRGVAVLFITPPAGGSLRDRRPDHRAARRRAHLDAPRGGGDPGSSHSRDGGPEVDQFYGVGPARTIGKQVCRVRGLGREGVFSGIDFDLHEGEVLGFAGWSDRAERMWLSPFSASSRPIAAASRSMAGWCELLRPGSPSSSGSPT